MVFANSSDLPRKTNHYLRQVSWLRIILLARLLGNRQWHFRAFVTFTVGRSCFGFSPNSLFTAHKRDTLNISTIIIRQFSKNGNPDLCTYRTIYVKSLRAVPVASNYRVVDCARQEWAQSNDVFAAIDSSCKNCVGTAIYGFPVIATRCHLPHQVEPKNERS